MRFLLFYQEEIVAIRSTDRLASRVQLRCQAIHGESKRQCLQRRRQAPDGCQVVGRGVQPTQPAQKGTPTPLLTAPHFSTSVLTITPTAG